MKSVFFSLLLAAVSMSSICFGNENPASSSAAALNDNNIREIIRCHYAGKRFELISAGIDPIVDPDQLTYNPLLYVRGQATHLVAKDPKNIKYGLYKFSDFDNAHLRYCGDVSAFEAGSKILAIPFGTDARPGGEVLGVFFYNTQLDKIVGSNPSLGSDTCGVTGAYDCLMSPERAKTYGKENPEAAFYFATRQLRSGADYGNASIEGINFEYTDEDLGIWHGVSLKDGKVVNEIDPDLTWGNSRWRFNFKDRNEFETLSGWDPAKQTYALDTIWAGRSANNTLCVQFAKKKEDIQNNLWKCHKS